MLHLVINLDRSISRWESITNELLALGVHPKRVSAIDGHQLSVNQINSLIPPENSHLKLEFPRQLTKGEIGCFLSHKKCWKHLLESNDEWALIMEDDILFSPRSLSYIHSSEWIPNNVGVIQVSAIQSQQWYKVSQNTISLSNSDVLVEPIQPASMGAQAYFINRNSARNAIRLSSFLTCPVDEFLFSYHSVFKKNNSVFRLNPALTIPKFFESTINCDRKYPKRSLSMRLHPYHLIEKLKFNIKLLSCKKNVVML